jgi:hypothetical protein
MAGFHGLTAAPGFRSARRSGDVVRRPTVARAASRAATGCLSTSTSAPPSADATRARRSRRPVVDRGVITQTTRAKRLRTLPAPGALADRNAVDALGAAAGEGQPVGSPRNAATGRHIRSARARPRRAP